MGREGVRRSGRRREVVQFSVVLKNFPLLPSSYSSHYY
jgi:hypothetical protein